MDDSDKDQEMDTEEQMGAEDNAPEDDLEGDERLDEGDAFKPAKYWGDLLGRGFPAGDGATQLADEIRARGARASDRLKGHLAGNITLEIDRSGKQFAFEFAAAQVPSMGAGEAAAPAEKAACRIRISEDNFLRIASGDLNPQVAMLSDKVRVDGKHALAIYFFNLVAPTMRR